MTTAPPIPTIPELERDYLLQNYGRYPLVVSRGKGCHLYDIAGRRYLDFVSGIGVNALGHSHPRIVNVVRRQVALLVHWHCRPKLCCHQSTGQSRW